MYLDDRYGVQQADATGLQYRGAAQLIRPVRRGDQCMLLVAQRVAVSSPPRGRVVVTVRSW